MLIAIVDDDPRMRILLEGEASDEGWKCLCCSNGQELLDLMMPVMDGLTCLRHLRSRGFRHRVIVITALCDPQQKQLLLEAGADQYLLKTALLEGLRDLVGP